MEGSPNFSSLMMPLSSCGDLITYEMLSKARFPLSSQKIRCLVCFSMLVLESELHSL